MTPGMTRKVFGYTPKCQWQGGLSRWFRAVPLLEPPRLEVTRPILGEFQVKIRTLLLMQLLMSCR